MPRQDVEFVLGDFETLSRMTFQTGAGTAIAAGQTITQATPNTASGFVHHVELTSGSWVGGDAAGFIWYGHGSDPATDPFVHTGGTVTGSGGGTVDPTAVVTEGILDAILPTNTFTAVNRYTPFSAAKVRLLDIHLTLILGATEYGLVVSASDEIQIPMRVTHGVRARDFEGNFYAFGFWDNSAGDLVIFVGFQGLQGDGGNDRDTIPKCVFSGDESASECGGMQPLDLGNVTGFVLSFDTDDTADGSNSQDPSHGNANGGYRAM